MKKSNWELTLEYLDRHKWQGRIIAAGIALSFIKSDIITIVKYFLTQI
jgi:hypothetical protein